MSQRVRLCVGASNRNRTDTNRLEGDGSTFELPTHYPTNRSLPGSLHLVEGLTRAGISPDARAAGGTLCLRMLEGAKPAESNAGRALDRGRCG